MLVSRPLLSAWLENAWDTLDIPTPPVLHEKALDFMWDQIVRTAAPRESVQDTAIYETGLSPEFLFHQFLEHLAKK